MTRSSRNSGGIPLVLSRNSGSRTFLGISLLLSRYFFTQQLLEMLSQQPTKKLVILHVVTQQFWKCHISNFVSELTVCKNNLGEQFYTIPTAAKRR